VTDIPVELRNAPSLAEPPGYSHVAIGRGQTLVFTAGAVPLDREGRLVGEGDGVVQAEQAIANLLVALEAGGAGSHDIAKTTVYVAGGNHAVQVAVWELVRHSPIGRAPSTLVGVPTLGYRGQLVEIEAIAVLD
jgi:enamine deaminase RidA (YjgF/YER057c/UK114 family)